MTHCRPIIITRLDIDSWHFTPRDFPENIDLGARWSIYELPLQQVFLKKKYNHIHAWVLALWTQYHCGKKVWPANIHDQPSLGFGMIDSTTQLFGLQFDIQNITVEMPPHDFSISRPTFRKTDECLAILIYSAKDVSFSFDNGWSFPQYVLQK